MNITLKILLATLSFVLVGCPLAQPKKAKVAPKEETSEEPLEDEKGIDGISSLVKRLNQTIREKNFKGGALLLRKAELSVQRADEVTRSHPEFEDTQTSVQRARRRFEVAVEKDRIERRNAAIDKLIAQGQTLIERGGDIEEALRVKIPDEQDVSVLSKIVNGLKSAAREGLNYGDTARYVRHARLRDERREDLHFRLDAAIWQVTTFKAVGPKVESGFAAVSKARQAKGGKAQLDALRAAQSAFAECDKVLQRSMNDSRFDPAWPIETRLGRLTVPASKGRCEKMKSQVQSKADSLAWLTEMNAMVVSLTASTRTFMSAQSPSEKLASADKANVAFKQCSDRVDALLASPGRNAAQGFASAYGEVNDLGLKRNCEQEARMIKTNRPRWAWQIRYIDLAKTAQLSAAKLKAVSPQASPASRIEVYRELRLAFEQCSVDGKTLVKTSGADLVFIAPGPDGPRAIKKLLASCAKARAQSAKGLQTAERDRKLEQFTKDLQGEEVLTVRREGIPSEVLAVPEGRVLIYKKGRSTKRFEFDAAGKAANFKASYVNRLQKLHTTISEVFQKYSKAATGNDELKGANDAIEAMRRCATGLKEVEGLAGYSASVRAAGFLGKLSGADLRRACVARQAQIEGRLEQIRWRISAEKIAARGASAKSVLDKSESMKSDLRLKALGGAIGDATECKEQGGVLLSEPGNNKKQKLGSSLGTMTLSSVIKVCAALIKKLEGAVKKAESAQALDTFLKGCREDERGVVERMGIPDAVEKKRGGRVFVYGSGAKAKRLAFDKRGKRTTESVLK